MEWLSIIRSYLLFKKSKLPLSPNAPYSMSMTTYIMKGIKTTTVKTTMMIMMMMMIVIMMIIIINK